jgi:hypothetical protein
VEERSERQKRVDGHAARTPKAMPKDADQSRVLIKTLDSTSSSLPAYAPSRALPLPKARGHCGEGAAWWTNRIGTSPPPHTGRSPVSLPSPPAHRSPVPRRGPLRVWTVPPASAGSMRVRLVSGLWKASQLAPSALF